MAGEIEHLLTGWILRHVLRVMVTRFRSNKSWVWFYWYWSHGSNQPNNKDTEFHSMILICRFQKLKISDSDKVLVIYT